MNFLYKALSERVEQWRNSGYVNESYPAIAEILHYALTEDEPPQLRYLRSAQLLALESYWFLRLELDTATVPDLYEQLFPKAKDRRIALGLDHPDIVELIADTSWDDVIERVKTDNDFVRQYKLESLRETLTLNYPSYILALAMGAGKTILMGTIVATEFAMAQEYPEADFVKNALIFAPGKTIIESLREIADIPFDKVLPARLCKPFLANVKLTFTRDGERELPVVWGSEWNIVVTNTEKIRIQKTNTRGSSQQLNLLLDTKEEQKTEEANLRLQAIASLPNLAIFSDEAHHTYGQKLLGKWQKNRETGEVAFNDEGIKKVRRTVDFLAENTNLIVVINTTGTPYFERQPLRDVVVWYGLGQGIRDGILKELAGGIRTIGLDEDDGDHLLDYMVSDFYRDYWSVSLKDGSPARLALYFPNTDTRDKLRPAVDSALAKCGVGADVVLITINDVLSPSILQRLNKDEGLFRAQITDWRAQVDTVLIDTDYNGEIFNVVHSDVPERKKDLVVGEYRLRSPKKEASIAVKIIDMLGEEFIWVETP
ncbi:DEAD/DEAH box helicase family protein [Leucothrix pacifica]|uniref:Helicase/UvrB N-terminal domain-containing protein n=1 Tax=Leucothrix pacifica TaxID=1247513 RepID=A0A317CN50_9GAMM|nr:DEAD/DEAH box helicase family protein [Leucothrix pacifica]PWQ97742.1 hypothetical protein DKW60_10260 [Leucothrix pacifica]